MNSCDSNQALLRHCEADKKGGLQAAFSGMDALSSSAFLRISAIRTEGSPPRTTIPQPYKPRTTTSTTTTTKPKPKPKPKLEKSRSPGSSPPPPPAKRTPAAPPSIPAALCNALDDLINNFIDPAVHRPPVDPRHVLSCNWDPVGELPPTPCPVVRGRIPRCLAGGAYIRNGPNPQHLPRGPHHLFDGDGMLHSLLLSSTSPTGDATLCSHYVHTYKYLLEREAGGPVLPSFFAGFHGASGIARGVVVAAQVRRGS